MAAAVWSIDNKDPAEQHTIEGSGFRLEVKRLKDKWDNEEKVVVTAYRLGGSEPALLGTTQLEPVDLEGGLAAFKKYGVMLSRSDCIEIAKCIRENYYSFHPLPCYDGSIIDESCLQDILELLGNMIEGNHIEAATVKPRHLPDSCTIYPIPVKLFNEEIQRSQFQAITPKAIQEYLYQGGFTLANRGSLDYVASTGDGKSKQKCVCLYKEKMKDFVEQAGQEGPQA